MKGTTNLCIRSVTPSHIPSSTPQHSASVRVWDLPTRLFHWLLLACVIGLFATALNLLPIGQLDGGHILYALFGPLHRRLSQLFALALLPLGWFFWTGWILWAIFFLITGLRRPPIIDEFPVGAGRTRLGLLAAVILLLSFTPNPIQTAMAL
jgi:hypothetical protein